MKRHLVVVLLVTILASAPAVAGAFDWSTTAHITYLEIGNLDEFRFQLDVSSQCGSSGNGWYLFDARFLTTPSTPQADRREIIKRQYATVLAAKLSGQAMDVYGDSTPDPNGGGCIVGFANLH